MNLARTNYNYTFQAGSHHTFLSGHRRLSAGRICGRWRERGPSSDRWTGCHCRSSQPWWRRTRASPDPGSHRGTGQAPQTESTHKQKETQQRSRVTQQTKLQLRTGEGFPLERTAYLKVLGVTGRGRNGHLLVPEDGVDGRTFPHVGISNLFNTFIVTY